MSSPPGPWGRGWGGSGLSFPPLPLLPSQHQMVDSFFNKHQYQPEGQEQVGHCAPHSPALYNLAWVGGFTMMVVMEKMKMLPQVCPFLPLDRSSQ